MKLTMVIESNQDAGFIPKLIAMLAYKPLAEIIAEPEIAERIPALMERHRRSIEIMRERTECKDGTVFFDVTDHELEGYNKFIPYYLNPKLHLQRGTEQEQLPDQGVGGIESVGAGRADRRTWRRFASAMAAAATLASGLFRFRPGQVRSSATGGEGDCRGVAGELCGASGGRLSLRKDKSTWIFTGNTGWSGNGNVVSVISCRGATP